MSFFNDFLTMTSASCCILLPQLHLLPFFMVFVFCSGFGELIGFYRRVLAVARSLLSDAEIEQELNKKRHFDKNADSSAPAHHRSEPSCQCGRCHAVWRDSWHDISFGGQKSSAHSGIIPLFVHQTAHSHKARSRQWVYFAILHSTRATQLTYNARNSCFIYFSVALATFLHSDKGSMIPGIPQRIRTMEKTSGHSDRVLAQNFDAVLAGIVIWADGSYLQILLGSAESHSKTPTTES